MSLRIIRRRPFGDSEPLDICPGDRLEVLDDHGHLVMTLMTGTPDDARREDGDTTTRRSFIGFARQVFVADRSGRPVEGRLALEH